MQWITDPQLKDWLAGMMTSRTVIAPRRVQPDLVLYQAVDSPDAIAFDFTRAALAPKEFFFPATEAILLIEKVRQAVTGEKPTDGSGDSPTGPSWDVKLTEPTLERDQVVFAIRPCDANALTSLDALMLKETVDAYYARRRERTTLIGLACDEMGPNCFCTSLGSTPDDPQGVDVMLYRSDGGYLLESRTAKGEALVAGLAMQPYKGERVAKTWPPAAYTVPPRQVWTSLFNDAYWGQLADRCLSCKICSYTCPTCRCFDVRDYVIAQGPGYQQIERLRCWDACLGESYRRIAGGHNPRPTKMQRLRNRFYCKFDYYPADFGPLACVGCGRCIEHCPVNVDITEVLATVAARGG